MSVRIEVERLQALKLNEGEVLFCTFPESTDDTVLKFAMSVLDRAFPNNKVITSRTPIHFQLIAAERAKEIKK